MQKFRLPLILTVIPLLAILACDGDLSGSRQTHTYRLQGLVVVDQNLSQRSVVVNLWRNDSLYNEAQILADGKVVSYTALSMPTDSAYSLIDTAAAFLVGDSLSLTMTDSSQSFDLSAIVPDSFSMLSLVPFNHIVAGLADNVTLDWSGSAAAEGYILAAVKADLAYQGRGYSAAVATQITGGTIPPDAFLLEGSVVADTGLYNIYIYAITGAPDSALASKVLPTPIPQQSADNLSEVRFSGWFGAIQVVYRDTVRVVTSP